MARNYNSYERAGKYDPAGSVVRVYYGGRKMGFIKKVETGYQYFPIDREKSSHAIFQTIEEVKETL